MRDRFLSFNLFILWISLTWNYDLQMSQDTAMRRRPSANPAQPHCADWCHGRGLLLHQRQKSASTSGKSGWIYDAKNRIIQVFLNTSLKDGITVCAFCCAENIFRCFILKNHFQTSSCKCIRITQPLSMSFNICSCWIHVKVDWQFRFWWLFGISFPNCAACLGGQCLLTSSHLVNV